MPKFVFNMIHPQWHSHWCFYLSFWVFDFQHHFSFGSIQAPFLCLRLTSLLDCLLIFFELFSRNYNHSIEFFTSSSMSFFIRGHFYRVCILGRRNISLAFHLVFICSCGVNLLMEFFFLFMSSFFFKQRCLQCWERGQFIAELEFQFPLVSLSLVFCLFAFRG